MSVIMINNNIYDLSLAFDRKQLHSLVDNFYFENDMEEESDEFASEIAELHSLITKQDVSAILNIESICSPISFECLTFEKEPKFLQSALNDLGFQVEKSTISRSIYVKIGEDEEGNPLQLRVSDHKRPAVNVNGIYMDHNYYKEYITSNPYITGTELINLGFEVNTNEKYYF